MTLTGAIFCGGASSRMGQDKASLLINGRPMVKWIERAIRGAGAADVVALGAHSDLGLRALGDRAPGSGPLSALVGALEELGDLLVCPCDVPLVSAELFSELWERATSVQASVVLVDSDQIQPLIGIYKASALPLLRKGLHGGAKGPKQVLTPSDFERIKASSQETLNVNTPGELEAAVSALQVREATSADNLGE